MMLLLRCASVATVEQILTTASVAVQSSNLHHYALATDAVQAFRVILAILLSPYPRYCLRAVIAECFEGTAWHVVAYRLYKSVN